MGDSKYTNHVYNYTPKKKKEKMYRTLSEVKIVENFLKPINDIKPQVKK